MPAFLSGPGVGLPPPQNLYPTNLFNAPQDFGSNKISLNSGDAIVITAGDWYITGGQYCVPQYLDPITGVWQLMSTCAWEGGLKHISSDGFNFRIANLTSCVVSASITAYGANYTQATTQITPNIGTSTWLPIIGGQLTGSVSAAGAGYGVPPLILIPPPPSAAGNPNGVGGIQASAIANMPAGTVTGLSFTNPGAGYPSPMTLTLLPSPFDPNINSGNITLGTVVLTPQGAGSLCGVLCTNSGGFIPSAQIASLTLTVSGAGTGASVAPNVMTSLVSSSISGSGGGSGTNYFTTGGGAPTPGTITNSPEFLFLAFRPRPAQGNYPSLAAGAVANIIDGGLFMSAINVSIQSSGVLGTAPTLVNVLGGRSDIINIQPAP